MKITLSIILAALLAGCGSTIRLDYAGKGGTVGIGVTLPDAKKGLAK
jgi:uncharacterized protein YceK